MNTPYYVNTDDGLVPVGRYLDQKQVEVEIMKYQLLKAANVFGPHYINSMPEDLQEKVYSVLGVDKYLKEKASTNRHDDRIDAMRYALERHKQTVFPDSFYTTEPIDKSGWDIVSPSMTYLKVAQNLCEGLNIGLQLGKEEKPEMRMHVGAILKSAVTNDKSLWVVYRIEKVPANPSEDGYVWVAKAKEDDRLRNLMMRCTTYEIQEQFNNPDHTKVRIIYGINSDGSARVPGVLFATVEDIAEHDGKAKFKAFTEEIEMAEYHRDVFAGCNFHEGKLYFLPRGEANAKYIGRTTGVTVDYRSGGECPTGEVKFIIDHEGPKIKIGPEDQKTNYDMIKEMVNNSPVQKYKPDGSTKEEDIWCGSISERYSVEERMLFIIFDGLNKSVKICRTGWDDRPYKMCMYRDKGLLVANIAFTTWNELETQAMYLIHQYLHISFGPGRVGGKDKLTEALRDAKRVVKMIGDTQPTPNSAVAIDEVIFNDPATIVKWADGSKTVVKAHDEPFDKEKGLAMAICKNVLGNNHDYYNTFKKFLKDKKK